MKSSVKKKFFGTIIDSKLGIIVLNSHYNLYPLSKEIAKKTNTKLYIICGLWWSVENLKEIIRMVFLIPRNKLLYPNINVSILCNTEKETKLLKILIINAIHCNHNCFIDEKIFNIKKDSKKEYKAIYNAVLSKFKRHILCKFVPELALITYKFENEIYKTYLTNNLNEPKWINYKINRQPTFLKNEEIADIYNKSYVGLALSKVEGAMYSSTEYLLCGLPVVSTKSKGGRDIFYNQYNSIITPSDPESVRESVEKLISRKSDPEIIRSDALEIMKIHRNKFFNHVNQIYKDNGVNNDISKSWNKWFTNKLRNELYANEIINEIVNRSPKP